MQEIIINLHIHTFYSDGHGSHTDVCKAAAECGLDAIIVTDHNVLVQDVSRYYEFNGKKILLLTGEEVHDQTRNPQKNHLLVIGAKTEVSRFAENPQELINQVKNAGGLSFIAHPVDLELPLFHETNISWVDWVVDGFDGLEIWNGLSELKSVIRNKFDAIKFGLFPELLAHNPLPETISTWDRLLIEGKRIVAVGGSDSHALPVRMGFIKRTIFPYQYHFSAINTHIISDENLTGNPLLDGEIIYSCLRKGNAFIGYDLPRNTRGFRFTACSQNNFVIMGDEVTLGDDPFYLEICLPDQAEIHLIKNGSIIQREISTFMKYQAITPGVYRVEVYRKFLGKKRGWIFSNPIYIRSKNDSPFA